MAKSFEEAIWESVISAYTGSALEQEAHNSSNRVRSTVQESGNPSKAYMAIGTYIPKVGEIFNCMKLVMDFSNSLTLRNTWTSTVRCVERLSCNVFIVRTNNSYYVTRVLPLPVENVHFALIREKPRVFSSLKLYKMEFSGEEIRYQPQQTSSVQEVKHSKGLYYVKTRNSVYICYPMM